MCVLALSPFWSWGINRALGRWLLVILFYVAIDQYARLLSWRTSSECRVLSCSFLAFLLSWRFSIWATGAAAPIADSLRGWWLISAVLVLALFRLNQAQLCVLSLRWWVRIRIRWSILGKFGILLLPKSEIFIILKNLLVSLKLLSLTLWCKFLCFLCFILQLLDCFRLHSIDSHEFGISFLQKIIFFILFLNLSLKPLDSVVKSILRSCQAADLISQLIVYFLFTNLNALIFKTDVFLHPLENSPCSLVL